MARAREILTVESGWGGGEGEMGVLLGALFDGVDDVSKELAEAVVGLAAEGFVALVEGGKGAPAAQLAQRFDGGFAEFRRRIGEEEAERGAGVGDVEAS